MDDLVERLLSGDTASLNGIDRLRMFLSDPVTFEFCVDDAEEVNEALLEAAAELSRLSALVAWQDIETAPKDGTRILIEFVHANAKFSPDPVGEGWIAVHEAYWLDHNAGGWTWYGLSGVATRWLPLPTPPVSQLKDTTNADK